MKRNLNKWIKYIAILVFGLFLGWLFFKDGQSRTSDHIHEETVSNTIWTCSMHPQIRQHEPGKCPICGMDLVPASQSGSEAEGNIFEFVMTPQAMALANVSTTIVGTGLAQSKLNLSGKIQINEQKIATIAATFPGRVEKLYVNFTGQKIIQGQKLASVYSPEMITAQKELQEAASTKSSNPILYEAARERLLSWRFTEEQIDRLEESGKVQSQFDIYANRTGVVGSRLISVGDYVGRGAAMFELIELDPVWVMLDAYETDLPWIKTGDEVRFSVKALPGQEFTGKVSYIDPVINSTTRTASIRAEANNRKGELKPGMFVNAEIATTVAGREESLIIPTTAVLWTGPRSIVYVKVPDRAEPTFEAREISLGPRLDGAFVVKDGLKAGEEVVINGVFSIDAAAQLNGKRSMMNQGGDAAGVGHDSHNHGQMEPGNREKDAPMHEHFHGMDEVFKEQLRAVYAGYLKIKNALVESNFATAKSSSTLTIEAVRDVDMSGISGEAHQVWMEKLSVINSSLKTIESTNDLGKQRTAFARLSEILFQSLKQNKVDGINAYYQHCSMAMNDKGAYWISETKEIRNPYFGIGMLTCGQTEEQIEARR